ncbi:MAG: methyltransferase domain-containing protein [Alphaproteobacteria bacterium]|nr:methyltransferase domain-containing protein [Alphaproteobacteria bacterium]
MVAVSAAPKIFDRALYALRRARAARMEADRFLLVEAADHLAERLGAIRRRFSAGLELSSRLESATALAPFAEQWTRTVLSTGEGDGPVAEEEALPFAPESFDLVVSVLSLHAVNDLPGALVQVRRVLKPDGLFLAALFGGETLRELRAAFAAGETDVRGGISPRVAPFAEVRALGGLLQRAGFALPVADSERTTVHYREFKTLAGDLRALGEASALAERDKRPLRRDVLGAALSHYASENSDADGKLIATFDIIYLTGWAPHESQQKPLRPGSAAARLADALGTREQGI